MKKILLIVLIAIFPFGFVLADNSLFNQTTPEQSYISGNTVPAGSQNTSTTPSSYTQQQNLNASNAATTRLAKEVIPVTQIQDPAVKQSVRELQAQLSELNQLNLLFQQQTDQRLENLSSTSAQSQNQIKELAKAIGLLNQELTQDAKNTVPNGQAAEKLAPNSHDILQILITALLIIILIALIVLIAVIMRKQKQGIKIPKSQLATANNAPTADEDDTKAEYDFMNSNEAIPAKLDLARAYFDMEDYRGAREALNQVMAEGNPKQRQEAQAMLSRIPNK